MDESRYELQIGDRIDFVKPREAQGLLWGGGIIVKINEPCFTVQHDSGKEVEMFRAD